MSTDTLPQSDTTTPLTMDLATYVSGLRYDDLPTDVVDKTKQLIRDGLGNQLAASTMAEAAEVVRELVLEWGGAEQSTIIGVGAKVPTPNAALVNAMQGHGVELDDAHADALTKCGSAIIPAIVAVAEAKGRSGKDLITAAVAAYDVMVRIGLAINPSHRRRGFHTTGTASAFGTAAGAASLLGLDADQTADALGIAGMQAAGLQSFLDHPCMVKPLSPGKGAYNGVLAATLAGRGFTGPQKVLEGREGFLQAMSDEVDTTPLTDGLGSHFMVSEMGFKPHAACRYAHGPIDAMQTIVAENTIDPEDVDQITVRVCELAVRQSGRIESPNFHAAMGSTPFGMAVTITQGMNGLAEYRTAFADPINQELARKVNMIEDPKHGIMGRAADVEVTLTDGRTFERSVTGPRGEPDMPLSEDELRTKFLSLATLALGDEQAEQLADLLDTLESTDVASLIPLAVPA